MKDERGPDDFDQYRDARFRYQREIREGSDKGLLRWILTAVSSLFVAGILGLWSQNAQIAEMRADIRNLKEQLERLSRLVEPRYRGQQGRLDAD